MDDDQFDKIADTELHYLEKVLGDHDPDELEVDLASGVLTMTLGDGAKVVVNSHRAAREIWMAAFRQAWHFAPKEELGVVRWRTGNDELRSTISRILSDRLHREVKV